MAFIHTEFCARVALRYSLYGNDVVNTLWFNHGSDTNDPDIMSDLANAVDSWAVTELVPAFTQDMTLQDVTAISQENSTAASFVVVSGSAPGGVAQPGLPSGNCITLKFNTAQRGRSGRGRNYVAGLYEAAVTGDQVGSTFRDAVQAAYETIPTYLGVVSFTHVVVSFQLDNVARSEGFPQAVTSYQFVDANIDSQRRRLTGRGS